MSSIYVSRVLYIMLTQPELISFPGKRLYKKSDLFELIMVFVDTLDRQFAVSFMTLYKYFKA